jgi:hypothetical protein
MKVFTLVGFAAHLGKMVTELPHVQHAALEAAAVIVETEAKRVLGTLITDGLRHNAACRPS